jgi:hypothetical protein
MLHKDPAKKAAKKNTLNKFVHKAELTRYKAAKRTP